MVKWNSERSSSKEGVTTAETRRITRRRGRQREREDDCQHGGPDHPFRMGWLFGLHHDAVRVDGHRCLLRLFGNEAEEHHRILYGREDDGRLPRRHVSRCQVLICFIARYLVAQSFTSSSSTSLTLIIVVQLFVLEIAFIYTFVSERGWLNSW